MGRLCRSFLSHSQCPGYNASDVGDGVGTVRLLGVGRYHCTFLGVEAKKQKRKNENECYIDYFEIKRMRVVRTCLLKKDEEVPADD